MIENGGTAQQLFDLMENLYGPAKDKFELKTRIHTCVRNLPELPSAYLQRLHLVIAEAQSEDAISQNESTQLLIQQFCYGVGDDELLRQLKLDPEDQATFNDLDFGKLVHKLRKEEGRRARLKKVSIKSQIASDPTPANDTSAEPDPMLAAIQSIQKQLEETQRQLKDYQSQRSAGASEQSTTTSNGKHRFRKKGSGRQTTQSVNNQTDDQGNEYSSGAKAFSGWCYNCGLDFHKKANCRLPSNPEKVCERLQSRGKRNRKPDNEPLN